MEPFYPLQNKKILNKYLENSTFCTRTIITVKSGAKYSGFMYRRGDDSIILSRVIIINSFGGRTAPKGYQSRIFKINNIINVESEE